jgi:hypothetical protein
MSAPSSSDPENDQDEAIAEAELRAGQGRRYFAPFAVARAWLESDDE